MTCQLLHLWSYRYQATSTPHICQKLFTVLLECLHAERGSARVLWQDNTCDLIWCLVSSFRRLMKIKLILLIMSSNCIAFRTEIIVDIVTAVKQYFHCGCIYLLQNQETGMCRITLRLWHAVASVIWHYVQILWNQFTCKVICGKDKLSKFMHDSEM